MGRKPITAMAVYAGLLIPQLLLAQSTTQPATRPAHAPIQPGETRAMAIIQLGNFTYDPAVGGLPADVQRLEGLNLKTYGYMIPMEEADKITHFALIPTLFSCCFGQPPGVEHMILVECRKDRPTTFTNEPVVLSGTLHVREKREDGYTISIFELSDAQVLGPLSALPTKEFRDLTAGSNQQP